MQYVLSTYCGVTVKILISIRDIHIGDEICICYPSWDDPISNISPEEARLGLKMKWGIVCDQNCRCYDGLVLQYLSKARHLDNQILAKGRKGDIEGALIAADDLLALHKLHNEPMDRTYYDRFQLYIMTKKTLHKAAYDIDQYYKSKVSTLHPESEEVLEARQYAKDHSKHPSYLVFEK